MNRGVTIGGATCAKAPTSEPSQRSLNPKVERLRTFQEHRNMRRIAMTSLMLGLMSLLPGCIIGPREGDYDRDHHRYYHQSGWHECGDHDDHCR